MNNNDLSPHLSRICEMKCKKVFQNNFGNFKMRKMSDVGEFDDVRVRHYFPKPFDEVGTGNFVSQTVDKAQRNIGSLQRADPTLPIRLPFGHITNEFVSDFLPAVKFKDF